MGPLVDLVTGAWDLILDAPAVALVVCAALIVVVVAPTLRKRP